MQPIVDTLKAVSELLAASLIIAFEETLGLNLFLSWNNVPQLVGFRVFTFNSPNLIRPTLFLAGK